MRHASSSERSGYGRKRNTPFGLLLVAATLLLFALAALPGGDFSAAGVMLPETLADSHRHAPQPASVGEVEECAAHPAVCGAVLSVAPTAAQSRLSRSAGGWMVGIPGSGLAPEHSPPPPRLFS